MVIVKVLGDVGGLLPEVDGLLELHLALGKKLVANSNVLDKTVTFKLLTQDCAHQPHGHCQVVHLNEMRAVAHELTVQVQNTLAKLSRVLRYPRSDGECSSGRGHFWLVSRFPGALSEL